jgi:hypothetical protein
VWDHYLRVICGTFLHVMSDNDQTRPQHATQTHNKHHHHDIHVAQWAMGGQTFTHIIQGRGCTGEFSRAKAKKKFWFHIRKNN